MGARADLFCPQRRRRAFTGIAQGVVEQMRVPCRCCGLCIPARLEQSMVDATDQWAGANHTTRTAAIRQLIELGLKAHGGLSTGPKTAEGRVRIAEAQRRRWSAYRQEKAESSPSKPPAKVRVVSPYSYYADDGQLRSWWAGQVVTDKDQITDLIARKAPVEPVDPIAEAQPMPAQPRPEPAPVSEKIRARVAHGMFPRPGWMGRT